MAKDVAPWQELIKSRHIDQTGCMFCDHTGPICKHRAPNARSFRCTRPEGHTGPHVACGAKDHALVVWGP